MLRGEMPFGSWRENELDTVAKIAKRKLNLPDTFSPEAADLISKVYIPRNKINMISVRHKLCSHRYTYENRS